MCTFGSNFRKFSLIFVNYKYDFKINIKIINKGYYCDCHYGFPMWDHPKYIPTQSQYRTKPFSHWNPTLQKNEKKRKSDENMFLRKSKNKIISLKCMVGALMIPSFVFFYSSSSWSYRRADVRRVQGFANLRMYFKLFLKKYFHGFSWFSLIFKGL